jgi:hypothetical protein
VTTRRDTSALTAALLTPNKKDKPRTLNDALPSCSPATSADEHPLGSYARVKDRTSPSQGDY